MSRHKAFVLIVGVGVILFGAKASLAWKPAPPMRGRSADVPLTAGERHLVVAVAQVCRLTRAMGQTAGTSADASIKSLAKNLVRDAGRIEDNNAWVARRKKIDLPRTLDKKRAAVLARLRHLKGKALDRLCVDTVIAEFRPLNRELIAAARDSRAWELQSWATEWQKRIQLNLQAAELVHRGLASDAAAAVSRSTAGKPETSRVGLHSPR